MLWKDKKQSLWGELTHKKYAGLTVNDHLPPMGAIIARNGVNQQRRKIQQHTTHPFVDAESVQQQTCDNCTNHYLTIVPHHRLPLAEVPKRIEPGLEQEQREGILRNLVLEPFSVRTQQAELTQQMQRLIPRQLHTWTP